MQAFAYLNADSFAAASRALAAAPSAVAKAAGTDLLDLLKERVVEPEEVVNLSRVKPATTGAGTLSALTTLAELAADQRLGGDFPALVRAAAEAATPQVRNRGTLGGNLAQVSRCPYLRTRGFRCFRLGDAGCEALEPEAHSRTNAIFPASVCACAHPSNLAPALIALGATAVCVLGDERREVELEALYRGPRLDDLSDLDLRRGELIEAVRLVPSPLTRNSTYLELRERQSFDFALVSVAAAVHAEGGEVQAARIVCGGVAPIPHRALAAEQALIGRAYDAERIAAAAEAAALGARPLQGNGFKVVVLKRLVRRALEELKR